MMSAMLPILLTIAALTAVVRQLNRNHRRAGAFPPSVDPCCSASWWGSTCEWRATGGRGG